MTLLATRSPELVPDRANLPERALPFPHRPLGAPAEPRVSVLIPAHDAAHRLPRALRSVLGQGVTDLEVIVVDDASADPTPEVVEQVAASDPRVRLIRSPRNLGPGGARNLALEAARAPWVALLDSDDAFLPDRLGRLLRSAESTAAELVADNLILKDETLPGARRAMLPPGLLDRPRWLDAAAFLEGNLPIPGHPRVGFGFLKPIISRRFLARHGLGYRPGLRFAEDFDFYLRCLLAGGRWLLIPDGGYLYSVRGNSLTARHGAADLARLRRLDRHYLGSTVSAPALEAALGAHLRSVEDRLVWRLVLTSLKRGRLRRALGLALRSRHDLRQVSLSLVRALPHQVALRLRKHAARRGRMVPPVGAVNHD